MLKADILKSFWFFAVLLNLKVFESATSVYPCSLSAIISALLPRSVVAFDFNPNSLKHLANTISDALKYSFSSVELASIASGMVPIYFTISIKLFLVNDFINTSIFSPADLKLILLLTNEPKKSTRALYCFLIKISIPPLRGGTPPTHYKSK